MAEKANTTLLINKLIKRDFKIECTRNGVDMSETVEVMMQDYVKVSRQIHDENKVLSENKALNG